MAVALKESLLDESRMPAVVADAQAVLDAEVSDKHGASGLAVKGGYSAVKKISPSVVPDAISSLLPAFATKLEPFWQDYRGGSDASFAQHLRGRSDEVADALLSVTDERIEGSTRPAVKKVYGSMRPSAKKHVVEALPRLGDLVEKHAG